MIIKINNQLINLFIFFISIFAGNFLISCSTGEPRITYGFLNLVLYQGVAETAAGIESYEDTSGEAPRGTPPKYVEHFSFFVICEDEDGIENLDILYLYNDKEQIRWMINSSEWIHQTIDGNEWIGSRGITVPDGILPRGVFRAVLLNKSGESAERAFTYDGVVRFSFPELFIADGEYSIISQWPVNRLVLFDSSGNYLSTITLEALTGNLSNLKIPSSAGAAALWAEDESNLCSAYTNAVSIN